MSIYSFVADDAESKSQVSRNNFQSRTNDKNSETIKKEIEDSRRECLGWKIFKYKNSDSAIAPKKISIATFTEDGSEEEMMKKYEHLSAYGEGTVFTAINRVYAEEFTVITFNSTGAEISLSEIDSDTKKANAALIFKSVIMAISRLYDAFLAIGSEYIPLRCICEETVYVTPGRDGGIDFSKIKILPICANKNRALPEWLPAEAFSEKADIKTDIFSAGYLYRSIKGFDSTDAGSSLEQIIDRCYCVFDAKRPELNEILAVLGEAGIAGKSTSYKRNDSASDKRSPEYKEKIKVRCPEFIKRLYDKAVQLLMPVIDKIKEFLKSESNDRGGTTE